ncbi:protein GAST1-like [Phragmites australis]|uniref:protein GAST1-like n=1 Tax=Phragmites australis TaxID=29695 RepID=UPI002D795374|nr:protein GAST1-like [Phragmites australis]
MAAKRVSVLLLALLLLAVAFPAEVMGGNLRPSECSPKCASRCSRTQYKKACLTFCNKCCAKCLCVPPGFYGNKGACPCYNNWKTKEGGPKCP